MVEAAERTGLARRVARLKPRICIKGLTVPATAGTDLRLRLSGRSGMARSGEEEETYAWRSPGVVPGCAADGMGADRQAASR